MPSSPPTPLALPKLAAPKAASGFALSPAAKAVVPPGATPVQQLAALEQAGQSTDAINMLAHGMPERESTWWATQSARKVQNKLAPADLKAVEAAEAWVKEPTAANQALAGRAAQSAGFQGPGAWAAQAAASSTPPPPPVAGTPALAKPAIPGLAAPAVPATTPKAVAGSVQLSSALAADQPLPPPPDMKALQAPVVEIPKVQKPAVPPTQPPAAAAATAKAHQPFIDLGKQVAAGKNSWA